MNPLQLVQREVDQLKARLMIHQYYQGVFESPAGREVLHDLLRECGVFALSHNPQDPTPQNTAHNDGKRAVGLFVLNRLRMDNVPAIQKLIQEKSNDNRRPDDNDKPE